MQLTDHMFHIIQGLTAILLMGMGWWLKELNKRVGKLEEDVGHYEANVGIGNEKLEAIHKEISDHVRREEEHVWANINLLRNDMSDVKVSLATQNTVLTTMGEAISRAMNHVSDHEKDSAPWKERIVRVETRLDKLENGKGS